jgi:serine protease
VSQYFKKSTLLSLALILNLESICQAQTNPLVWYLQAPNSKMTAAAIDAQQLVLSRHEQTLVVAVIDNGIVANHPSLEGVLLPGWDMVSGDRNPKGKRSADSTPDAVNEVCPITMRSTLATDRFHGTKIASVIAANGKLGVTGINPHVKILPVKSIGACRASLTDLIDSIAWAGGMSVEGVPFNPYPAKVINISIANQAVTCHPQLQLIVDRLVERGVVILSAAGNTFGRAAAEPAICKGVIGVGAINSDQTNAVYSAIDNRITLLAPGGGRDVNVKLDGFRNRIRVATFKEVYDPRSDSYRLDPIGADDGVGTSFAAPLAAGAVAGVLLKNKDWTTNDLLKQIRETQVAQEGSTSRFLNYSKLIR